MSNAKNIDEIDFYLKSQYLTYNEEQRTFIQDILSQEDISSFEAIYEDVKTFSKFLK